MPSKRPFPFLFLPDVLQRDAVLRAEPPVHGYDCVVDQVGHRQPVEHLLDGPPNALVAVLVQELGLEVKRKKLRRIKSIPRKYRKK